MSSTVRVQNSNLISEEPVKHRITENGSEQFEDSSGALPKDSINGDGYTRNDQNIAHTESGNIAEENQEEVVTKESSDSERTVSDEAQDKKKSNAVEGHKPLKTGESQDRMKQEEEALSETVEEAIENNQDKHLEKNAADNDKENQESDRGPHEVFPAGAQSELLNETTTQNGAWSTQALESQNEKESQKLSRTKDHSGYSWKICKTTAGPDYIPCLDNLQAIRKLPSMSHYEHRERHCPDEAPTCLVPLPKGYRQTIQWPKSREKVLS